jgi:hypothetical protein
VPEKDTGAPPKAMIVIAVVIAVTLALVVAVLGLIFGLSQRDDNNSGPLALVPIPAPQASSTACTALLRAAPTGLTSRGAVLPRRELAAPAPVGSLAWGTDNPVVLRCGLDRPPELTPTSQLRVINGVQWLEVLGEGASTWYVVDREIYAALTVPSDAGTGPLQEISTAVSQTLPPQPPHD